MFSLSSCSELYNKIDDLNKSYNISDDSEAEISKSDESEIISYPSGEISNVSFHFIDYKMDYTGDTTYIKAGDLDILIDAGPRNSAAENIENYIDKYCTDNTLEYVIATHAHQDHIAGFVGTSTSPGIFDYYKIENYIGFSYKNTTSKVSTQFMEKLDELEEKGTNVYTGSDFYGDTKIKEPVISLAKGVTLTVLDNYYYHHKSSNENNYSLSTLFTAGSLNALFTGDLEEEGEKYLVELNELPKIDLFKAAHHGSYTANSEELLSVIDPKNVVFLCIAGSPEYTSKKENMFPSQAVIDRLSKYTDQMYCIRVVDPDNDEDSLSLNGNIVFSFIDGNDVKVDCSTSNKVLKDTEWFKENRTFPSN